MNKKLTIVVATYNAKQHIGNCLSSIRAQKDQRIELVVVDGGSDDGTLDLINGFDDVVSCIISEPDNGIYDAWNKGVENSSGEWLMFVGADDEFVEGALESVLNKLDSINSNEVDYISARNEYVGSNGCVLKIIGEPFSWNVFRKKMIVAHVGSLHSRRLFSEVGLYDAKIKICADYELLMRKGGCLKSLYWELIIARMRFGGVSFSTRAVVEAYKVRKIHKSVGVFSNLWLLLFQVLLFWRYKYLKDKGQGVGWMSLFRMVGGESKSF